MSEKEDSFAAMFEREAKATQPKRARLPRVGDRVEGIVVQIGKDSVFVELDGKRQAFFEAADLRAPDGTMTVREGEKVTAHVVESDAAKSIVRLGRSLGRSAGLASLEQSKSAGLAVEGKVTGTNKGGLEVDFGGTRAFCPLSQVSLRRVEDADIKALIGQSLAFLVTDIRDGGKNVVVSRRAVLEREASENAERTIGSLALGAVVSGKVTNVRDFGAFVDIGGIEGLIPRSEISHDRKVKVADMLKVGDPVEVQIQEIRDQKKITLSLKALTPSPKEAAAAEERKNVESAKGKSTGSASFGTFADLLKGRPLGK